MSKLDDDDLMQKAKEHHVEHRKAFENWQELYKKLYYIHTDTEDILVSDDCCGEIRMITVDEVFREFHFSKSSRKNDDFAQEILKEIETDVHWEISEEHDIDNIINHNIVIAMHERQLHRYINMTWRQLTDKERERMLRYADAIDGTTGEKMKGDGECIIDLVYPYSVEGRIEDGEIFIEDDAVIYNPLLNEKNVW